MIESRALFILSSALLGKYLRVCVCAKAGSLIDHVIDWIFHLHFSGVGLACIHIFHVSNVFERQTGYSDLSKIERQILIGQNQYYYYYQMMVMQRDFDRGLNKVLFDNTTGKSGQSQGNVSKI